MLPRRCNHVPVSPTGEMRTVPYLGDMLRFRGEAKKNGVTADGLPAIWADHESPTQGRLMDTLGSARAIIIHDSPGTI